MLGLPIWLIWLVSKRAIKKGYKYFLLRAEGDSMNEAGINDGDLLLIRQISAQWVPCQIG